MATRSIKDVQLQPRNQRAGEIGPSPFPLLILVLIIMAMLALRVRAEENRHMFIGEIVMGEVLESQVSTNPARPAGVRELR
jgi:hypothetical protein